MASSVASQESSRRVATQVPAAQQWVWARPLLVDWDCHSHESRWHLALNPAHVAMQQRIPRDYTSNLATPPMTGNGEHVSTIYGDLVMTRGWFMTCLTLLHPHYLFLGRKFTILAWKKTNAGLPWPIPPWHLEAQGRLLALRKHQTPHAKLTLLAGFFL